MPEDRQIGPDIEATLNTGSAVLACPTCGVKLAPGTAICPQDGTILESGDSMMQRIRETYEIVSVINSGGMGVVYKATHRMLQKSVAIKMLKPGHFSETALVRFQREGKIASNLSHPNIVAIHDFGVTEFGQPFMVMEFVTGICLADKIRQQGRMSIQEVTNMARQICLALRHAHEHGILHRDVKPGNIMLVDGSADIKVVDFGIAKFIEPDRADEKSLTETGTSLGSPLYMSPEQSTGKKLDAGSDLYSLGCVLFECLTGRPPFVGKSAVETIMAHLNESPPTLSQAAGGRSFPESMEMLVARLLNKDPGQRFHSADEVLIALRDLGRAPQIVVSQNNQSKHMTGPIAIACAILVLAGIASIALMKRPAPATQPAQTKSEPAQNQTAPAPQPEISANPLKAEGTQHRVPIEKHLQPQPLVVAHPASTTKVKKYNRDESLAIFMGEVNSGALHIDVNDFDLRDGDLESLQNAPRLRAIRLNDTGITDAGLATLSKLENLQIISVNHTGITNKGIAYICQLPHLHTLHLCQDNLTDACTLSLANIKTLSELMIGDTQISDKGIKQISCLWRMKRLLINRTLVTDDSIKLIVQNFPELEELECRFNRGVTPASLKYLASAPNLQRLSLMGCSIPPKVLEVFFAGHPNIQDLPFEKGHPPFLPGNAAPAR